MNQMTNKQGTCVKVVLLQLGNYRVLQNIRLDENLGKVKSYEEGGSFLTTKISNDFRHN